MNEKFYSVQKKGRSYLFFCCMMLLLAGSALASAPVEVTVTGKVTSADDGSLLPGVNIYLKGTQVGTITDADGKYSITASDNNAVIVFSYIGYSTQEVSIGGRTTIDVVLQPNTESLDEVVVTALGIKRDERSLGYSVGRVNGNDLNRVPQENVLNSLAGRVPGVTISSTGGPGSSVNMVIRGAKSLTNNQPLFVVDGVPLNNSIQNVSAIGSDNRVDYGNAIADLNPDNIESVSVLKGGAAAALYGSRAGNGVVMITTKTGAKAKKLTVNVSTNNTFDVPYKFLDFHDKYAVGVRPYTPDANPSGVLTIDEGSVAGVGPRLDQGYKAIQWNSPVDADGNKIPTLLTSHPNNVKNFVRTGITSTNTVSVSNSSDMVTYRLAYTNMSNRGIVPNSDLFRNTLDFNTSLKISNNVRFSTNVDFTRSNSNNRPAGNRGANPIQWAYYVSPHIDIRDMENYWVKGKEGLQQLTQDDGAGEYNNPYFLANEVNNSFVRDRVYGNVKLDWQITKDISVFGRYSLDTYKEQRETKIANSYTGEPRGAYGIIDMDRLERNADFLATYKKDIGRFHLSVSAGGNAMHQNYGGVSNASKAGTGLTVPGLYTIQNIPQANLEYSSSRSKKSIYSIYGTSTLGYKDMVYLDLTARNDWSSTLPPESRSYFYPSASLSVLVNEMVNISDDLSILKLRAAVSKVGNDTQPYQLYNILDNYAAWDGTPRLGKSNSLLTSNLKPEMLTTSEFGLELGLFNNRVRFEGTYYKMDSRNQIFFTALAPSSGFESRKINSGLLVSKGIELSAGATVVESGNWRWDVNVNYSRNRTKLMELSGGDKFYTFWTDGKGGSWTYVGEEIGDLYDAKLVTVEDKNSPYYGYPLLDDEGSWQSVSAGDTKNKIGNYNPDFLMGMQSTLSYKAFTLNLSFDWRQGGQFISQTYRYGESDLKTQRWLDQLINPGTMTGDALRDYLVANADKYITNGFHIVGGPGPEYGGQPLGDLGDGVTIDDGVFNPGVIAQYDADGNITGYTENLGGPDTKYIPFADNYPWSFMKPAMFDASFIKLREISLGYQLPKTFVSSLGLQSASFSLYARNLMLWTKAKIGVDPELAFQPEGNQQGNNSPFKQGIERYNVNPWTVSTGFKLSLTF
jgi:TonB-linked SusC/RagA family outer membrane protein